MSSQSEQREDPSALEQTVIEFLRDNPDFFERHPRVLNAIELPHDTGEAVSLVKRQVETLREQVEVYRGRLESLIAVARENESLNTRLHQLTLTLIDTLDFGEVLTVLQDRLQGDFGADAVELHIFSSTEANKETNPELDGFREYVDAGGPFCGRLPDERLNYLFGADADRIRSSALIPIAGEGLLGLLAIGSGDPDRYHPEIGTDYLSRLGEIVSKTLEVLSEPGF